MTRKGGYRLCEGFSIVLIWVIPKIRVPLGDPHNKVYSILGAILVSLYFVKLKYVYDNPRLNFILDLI